MPAKSSPRKSRPTAPRRPSPITLAIDVGGSGLKAALLDPKGKRMTARVRVETPVGAAPAKIVASLAGLVAPLGAFDRVSVGFPGVVRDGRVLTAPNLGNDGWKRFDLGGALGKALGKPVRVANDADLQGLAVVAGKGTEMVVTLGTGFGTGLYRDGKLLPHLEIAHLPFRKGETFDEQCGDKARRAVGRKRWSRRVGKAIDLMRGLTSFDHLYLGGGNARHLRLELPADVTIVSNEAGITGGVHLWND